VTKELKNYKDHIKDKFDNWAQHNYEKTHRQSGIACPVCNTELLYDSSVVLLSIPPQYKAWCPKGDWEGNI